MAKRATHQQQKALANGLAAMLLGLEDDPTETEKVGLACSVLAVNHRGAHLS